jgi:acyl carrier protein
MNRKEIFEKLTVIFREVMDNDEIVLEESTTAEDFEEWDSLAHVQLIEKIESVFGVKFSAKEMMSWDDIGEFVDSIEERFSN